ncbi:PilZ domain-containing protein [Altererythrobacter sp. GH1-8]|uniref:PilZ domain-containing protein n=1 Tax=Altererythrobacter sp. GH1-8 TaxID=3349333 RepID=UPI00374CF921
MANSSNTPPQASADESHSDADRRSEERAATVLRPALLQWEDFKTFCLVRNISSSGLKVRVFAPVKDGARISICMIDGVVFKGTVIWHENDAIGVAFDTPIALDDVLAALRRPPADTSKNRGLRLEVVSRARFIALGQAYDLEVLDISSRGIKARYAQSVPPVGEQGTLRIDDLPDRKATPRWAREDTAGFLFLDPLSFTDLGQWVMRQYQAGLGEQAP